MFTIENGVLKKYKGDDVSVIIPDGIEEIGEFAFYDCASLKEINLPENLTTIGSEAFRNCKSYFPDLSSLDSLKEIGDYAFSSCGASGSFTLVIPKSV